MENKRGVDSQLDSGGITKRHMCSFQFVFEGFAERENKAVSVSSPGQWGTRTWPLVC